MMKFNLFCILLLCIHYVTASGPAFKFTDARRKLFPKKTSKRLMKGVSTKPPLDEKSDSTEIPPCTGEVKARCDDGDVPVKLSVSPGYNAEKHILTIGKVNEQGSCLNDFTTSYTTNYDEVDEPDSSICSNLRVNAYTCKQYDCRAERRVETYKPYCDAKDTLWDAVLSVNFQEAYEEQNNTLYNKYVFCLQKEQRYSIIARSRTGKGWYEPINLNTVPPMDMRFGSIFKLESADETSNLIFQPSEVVENGYGQWTPNYYRGLDKVSPIPDYNSNDFTGISINVPTGEENDWYTFWDWRGDDDSTGVYTSEIEFMICPETSNGEYRLINNICVLGCPETSNGEYSLINDVCVLECNGGYIVDGTTCKVIDCDAVDENGHVVITGTEVGYEAFKGCTALESVSMPEVTSIGEQAFFGCTALTNVTMPKVTTIGNYAFYGCAALTEVNMPKVTNIDRDAFSTCTALTSVNMPKVKFIDDEAFFGCTALTTVNMPEVTRIQYWAFKKCAALTTVTMPKVTYIGDQVFTDTALTSVTMPKVTSIGDFAFTRAALTEVNMPNVTSIGNGAFSDTSLVSVTMPVVKTIGNYAFRNTVLDTVTMPVVESIGNGAFENCIFLTSASMPNVTEIGNSAFYGSALESVTMPNVETIGQSAFFGTALESVTMPKVLVLTKGAFQGCTALTSVNMPVVKSIGEDAFLDTGIFQKRSCRDDMLSSCSEESVQNIVEYTKEIHSC